MISRTFTVNENITLERISKALAKKLYASNETIVFCPCNQNPIGMLGYMQADRNEQIAYGYASISDPPKNDFERLANSATYYNCNNELGKYLAWYKIVRR